MNDETTERDSATAVPPAAPIDASQPTAANPVLTRRTVLAAATAAGIGVAASRLLALANEPAFTTVPISGGLANKGGLDWVSPLSSDSAKVAHLLRRATFGATQAELDQARSDGYAKTVDRLIESPIAEPPVFPGGDDASQDKGLNVGQLQQWWLDWMQATPTPFGERMTLFWHGHFTSDYRKVADNTFMYWQNLTWRRMSMTNLRSMLMEVTTDPAMLRYLDLATSTGQNPNENYSRELMELFTMGAGNYTEEDVRESAKALAGWQLPQPDSFATGQGNRRLPVYVGQKAGIFNPRRAYKGSVTYLGKTGPLDTQGVIDRILAQPATAQLIATKVAQHFVCGRPGASYVTGLADVFRRSKYDVKTLMHAVFTSSEFTADGNYRGLVKSPAEFMLGTARALGSKALGKLIAASGSGMGQSLFDPPDVNGWPSNESWISSNTVVERVNFVTGAMTQSKSGLPSASDAVHVHLDDVLSAQTASLLNQAMDDGARWFVTLASPEFQLK